MVSKKPLVILTGPTAVGKTALSIKLAEKIGGEIISADSMQVYRFMDIGSAKITTEEMNHIPHHLIDILNPDEEFNVVLFQKYAKDALEEIYKRGHIPIVTGGTGFYIQALLYDIDFTETEADSSYRKELELIAMEKGEQALHQMLMQIDPQSAEYIHPNNRKRIIRALEYFHETGEKISEHNEQEHKKETPYNACYFVLNDDRNAVYKRIDERVEKMLSQGLLEEVQGLKQMGLKKEMISMQGLGYKELFDYLEGNSTLEEAIYTIKRDSRHFAKRQLTWFRREKDVIWLERVQYQNQDEKILEYMLQIMKQRELL